MSVHPPPALMALLTIGGQTAEMALACAAVLRRFDPVAALATAPAAGAPGTMS